MLYKTQLCSFYAKGICARGSKCSWAHGQSDVRPMPKFYKTRMCYTFLSGSYCEASKCTFAHTEDELRGSGKALRLCTKFFLDGYCNKSDKCPMAHHISQLDPSVKFTASELMNKMYNNEETSCHKENGDTQENDDNNIYFKNDTYKNDENNVDMDYSMMNNFNDNNLRDSKNNYKNVLMDSNQEYEYMTEIKVPNPTSKIYKECMITAYPT